MGVYNSVQFICPNCDEIIEEQSHAVDGCRSYDCNEVPEEIADDIEGECVFCPDCSKSYIIVRVPPKKTVRLGIVGDR